MSLRTGRAVKQQREAVGFSLRALASRSGISSSMISDIKRGAKSPTVTTVVRIAQALGGGAASLIDGGINPALRIHILRRGEGAEGEHPGPWESLRPATPDSRIEFMRYQIPPSAVLSPDTAQTPGRRSIRRWPPARSASPCATKRRISPLATAAAVAPTPHMGSRTSTRRSKR